LDLSFTLPQRILQTNQIIALEIAVVLLVLLHTIQTGLRVAVVETAVVQVVAGAVVAIKPFA
jgi:hypothetical protein